MSVAIRDYEWKDLSLFWFSKPSISVEWMQRLVERPFTEGWAFTYVKDGKIVCEGFIILPDEVSPTKAFPEIDNPTRYIFGSRADIVTWADNMAYCAVADGASGAQIWAWSN